MVKLKKHKNNKNKWITSGILRSIKHRDGMYKKLKTENPNSHKYITIKTNLKTYTCNTILKRSRRLTEIQFYHSHFAKYKNDAPKTWSLINSIMNRTKKNSQQPDTIEANYILLSDPLQIANAFNSYFVNIRPNLAKQLKSQSTQITKYTSKKIIQTHLI